MDENNQTSQEILEQLRIQTEAVNSLADVFVKTMTKEQREQWMLDQNVKRTGAAFNKLGENLNELSEAEKARIAGEREAAAVVKSFKEAGAAATKGLFNLSSTLANTNADLTKWGSTIGGVGDVAMDVGKHFGLLGNVVGGVIKGFSVMAPMLLDQTQKMLKAFDTLSEMGGTTNMTTEQVRELGRASGYTVDNLDKFVNSVKIIGKDINALGMSSAEGTKLFGKMTAVGEKNIQAYNRLGISQEQLTEAQAMYVKQSANAGIALSKSPKELQRASLEYVDELIKLKELTGMSVKESQSALDQARADENFNAYLFAKGMERSELEKRAEAESDPVRKKELEARAAQVTQIIKAKEELATWSKANESARDSTALLQSISRDSAPIYTQTNAHFLVAGRNIESVADRLNKGESALRDYQGEIVKSVNQTNKAFGEMQYAAGDASKQLQQVTGVDNRARANAAALKELETEAGRKRQKELDKSTQDQIERRKKEGEIIDPETGKAMRDGAKDTENTVLALERALRGLKDDLLGALNPFTKTTLAASAASAALAAAAGIAAYKLGKMGVGSAVGGIGDLMNKGLPGRTGPAAGSLSGWKAGATAAQGAVGATSAVGGAGSAATAATAAGTALSKLAGPLAGLSKAAPMIGTVMSVGTGVVDAYQGIKKADKDLKEGKITKEEARVEKGEAVGGGTGTAIGGTAGALKGAAAGAAIGSVVPVLGTAVGGIIGAALGGWLGSKAGKAIGEVAGGGIAKMTSDADKKVDEASKKAESKKDGSLAKDAKPGSDVVKVSIVKVEDPNLMKALGAMTPGTKLRTSESTGNVATNAKPTGNKEESISFTFNEKKLAERDEKLYKEYIDRKQEIFDKELEKRKKQLGPNASTMRLQGAEKSATIAANLQAKDEFAERAEKVGAAKINRPAEPVKPSPQTVVAKAPEQPAAVASRAIPDEDTQRKIRELEEDKAKLEKQGPATESAQSTLAHKNLIRTLEKAIEAEKVKIKAAPKAAVGGIFDGPKSGYPVELHGKEMITPLGTGAKTASLSSMTDERDEELEKEIEALQKLKDSLKESDTMFTKLTGSLIKLNKIEEEKIEEHEDEINAIKEAQDKLKNVFRGAEIDLSKFSGRLKVITDTKGASSENAAPAPAGGAAGGAAGGTGVKPPSAPPMAGMGGGTGITPPPVKQDVKQNLGDIKASMIKRGMGDEKYLNAVLGNVMKESGGKVIDEKLDYSKTSNARIRGIFKSATAGKSDEEINAMKSSPESMAEAVYGKDTKIGRGMGNIEPGDGFKYRGRGYIQLTGKSNYAAASQAIFGDDTLVKNPDLVNDPKIAADVVAWYMERGKAGMAKAMGIDEKNMTQQDANLLATSQIAGGDVRKKSAYLAGEVMNKVAGYAGSKDIQSIQPSSGGTMVASADTKKSNIPKAQKGGVFEGPETGYIVELHGNETVIPTDKIESLAKKELASFSKMAGNVTTGGDTNEIPAIDTTAIAKKSVKLFSEEMGPTFAGMNEYTGYNAGPMSTDLKAVQGMASKVGAYDDKTQTITDTEAWKKILHSGIATNYDMGPAKVGTEQFGPDAGNVLGDRLKEIMDMDKTSLTDAIKQLQEEFKAATQQMVKDLAQNAAAPIVEGADDSVMAEVARSMTELVNKMSESNDIQGKILQYSQV
jgi:predicted chitinase